MRAEASGPGARLGTDTGCRPPGLQEAGARWGRVRHQGAGAQGLALSKALNQARAGRPGPPCTPRGRGAGRSRDCCGYCHQLPKVSGHGGKVLGQSPQAIGGGDPGGATLARPLLLGSRQNLEEPRLAPSGPPGLAQELWGCPGQVSSPGKDRVPPRQWPSRPCLPRQGAEERVTLCRPRAIFHPYRPSVTRRPRRRTLMLHAVPAGGPRACPPPHRASTSGRTGACGQVGGRAQSSLTRWADRSHASL